MKSKELLWLLAVISLLGGLYGCDSDPDPCYSSFKSSLRVSSDKPFDGNAQLLWETVFVRGMSMDEVKILLNDRPELNFWQNGDVIELTFGCRCEGSSLVWSALLRFDGQDEASCLVEVESTYGEFYENQP